MKIDGRMHWKAPILMSGTKRQQVFDRNPKYPIISFSVALIKNSQVYIDIDRNIMMMT